MIKINIYKNEIDISIKKFINSLTNNQYNKYINYTIKYHYWYSYSSYIKINQLTIYKIKQPNMFIKLIYKLLK